MNRKTVLLILVSIFLLSAMVTAPAITQTRIAGFNAGDWFKYSGFDVTWSSPLPNATIPIYASELNNTAWMRVTVISVIGTNVTAHGVLHFKDGTEDAWDFWRDVDTGDGEGFGWFWSPISANLNANDTAWSHEIYSNWLLNEPVTRTYPDGPRETIHITNTTVNNIPWDYMKAIFYWDRPTGVPVELFYEHEKAGEEYMSYEVVITESNVWTIPEFPTWTPMLLMLFIFAVAIVIYKRRLKN